MDDRTRAPRLRPWMVAVAVVLIAVIGASTVYVMGSASKRRDRADILAYETATRPQMVALDAALVTLRGLAPRLESASAADRRAAAARHRDPLEAARASILELRVPDILRHIEAEQLNAINRTIGVITQLDRIVAGADPSGGAGDAYRRILRVAETHRASAVTALADLRCLAGLGCP